MHFLGLLFAPPQASLNRIGHTDVLLDNAACAKILRSGGSNENFQLVPDIDFLHCLKAEFPVAHQ
jgi:hypothetical protein